MKVSIIILNWNRADDTIDCLKSLSELLVGKCQLSIVIVDNASTDHSVVRIESSAKKIFSKNNIEVELLKNKKNLGFSGGNNVGIRHSLKHSVDYILVLNNDTIVDKKLLTGLLDTARTYPKAGLISPKIYFAKGYEFQKGRYKKFELGKVIWYAGGNLDWDNVYGANRGVDEVDKGQFKKVEETDFATGACMLIKAKSIKEVGMFDEQYYMYLEDADLSYRMKKSGWAVLYSPKGHMWHKVAQSSGIGGNLNDYFITRNRLIFGMRYSNLRTRMALYKESLLLLLNGREWQKRGVVDFYFLRYGKGSWKN